MAAVGIYGVIAYGVAHRKQEFGIRLALGAQSRDVVKQVMWQGMALVLVGHAFGLLASLGLTRLLKCLLFGMSATDRLTYCVTTLLLTCVALGACYIPARRAMKEDPIVAMAYE